MKITKLVLVAVALLASPVASRDSDRLRRSVERVKESIVSIINRNFVVLFTDTSFIEEHSELEGEPDRDEGSRSMNCEGCPLAMALFRKCRFDRPNVVDLGKKGQLPSSKIMLQALQEITGQAHLPQVFIRYLSVSFVPVINVEYLFCQVQFCWRS